MILCLLLVTIGISELRSEPVQTLVETVLFMHPPGRIIPMLRDLALQNLTNGLGKVLLCKLNDGFRMFLKNKKVDVELNEEKCSNKKPVVEAGPAC